MKATALVSAVGAVIALLVGISTLDSRGWMPQWKVQAEAQHIELKDELTSQIEPLRVSACKLCIRDCLQWCPTKVNPPEGCETFCRETACADSC